MTTETTTRPINVIAKEIYSTWKNVYFGAAPYLAAMRQLNSINDNYIYDSAESVVRYFLCNATSFRGPDARRIKAELQLMLKEAGNERRKMARTD